MTRLRKTKGAFGRDPDSHRNALDPNGSEDESESLVNWIPVHKKIYSFL